MDTITEQEKINMCCFFLIKQAHATGADNMEIKQEGVFNLDEKLGNWTITVKKDSGIVLPRR